jgi:precorrin-3B C17-methyltransferase
MCREHQIRIVSAASQAEHEPKPGTMAVEVIPGIPALGAGAALLGSPLMHDFAVISLSDLLTPWEVIERRLSAAAEADFVIVLYNPKSKRRKHHLENAQQIIMQHRHGSTPVGIVTRATRPGECVKTTILEQLHSAEVDMQTIVFIGSSASYQYLDFMVTPRGYNQKYKL